MKKIIIKDSIPNIENNVSCIGYFDGVHRGHQALIKVCIDLAKMNNLKSMVICFDPDPSDVINKNRNKHILSFKDRLTSFENLGVDIVCVIKFSNDLMKLSPESFIKKYLSKMNINTLVCGYDFSFGYLGNGDSKLLSNYLNTVVVSEVKYYSKKISSTRIKEAIINGNFKLVNKLLGYSYSLMLNVLKCSKNASKWLVECELKDKTLLLPKIINNKDFYIENNHIFIKADSKIKTSEEILIVFDNE